MTHNTTQTPDATGKKQNVTHKKQTYFLLYSGTIISIIITGYLIKFAGCIIDHPLITHSEAITVGVIIGLFLTTSTFLLGISIVHIYNYYRR